MNYTTSIWIYLIRDYIKSTLKTLVFYFLEKWYFKTFVACDFAKTTYNVFMKISQKFQILKSAFSARTFLAAVLARPKNDCFEMCC